MTPRTARARAGGLGKGGWATQAQMNNADVLRAATAAPPRPYTSPVYRSFQQISKRYRVGNIQRTGDPVLYIIVDTETMEVSGWLTADDIKCILFIEWLSVIWETFNERNT